MLFRQLLLVVALTSTDGLSLHSYLAAHCRNAQHAAAVSAVAASAVEIASLLARAPIDGNLGGIGETSGDRDAQKPLDILSNEIMKTRLFGTGVVSWIATEEEDDPIASNIQVKSGLTVCFDPLDGSSNIDCASPTGTIFSIADAADTESFRLRRGDELSCAGYVLYSSSTELVLALGRDQGVCGFTLSRDSSEFVLARPNIKVPPRGQFYSLNDGRSSDWPTGLQRYIQDIKDGRGESGKRYSSRYVCSLVADVHRTLLYGGWAGNPRSHLRLLFEGAPLAFVLEAAGGAGTDGVSRLLSIQPSKVHHRLPVFLGSELDVRELQTYGDVQQK